MGHSFSRCNQANLDELNGLFKKEGNNVKLPDGTQVSWDRNRPYKIAVDQFHQEKKQPGIINLPSGTLKSASSTEPQASFGQLEEIHPEEELSTYDCDVGKRTRSGKEYQEEATTSKKVRQEKEDLMEMDQPLEFSRSKPIPNQSLEPKEKAPTKKVQIQTPEETNSAKEKPAKKTILERPLAKEYPEAEDRVVSRMLNDGKLELTYAEIFAISPGAVETMKKKISPRRVPVEPTLKTTNTGEMEEEEDQTEENPSHYACPLGYISISINGKQIQALLDNGSQVNLLPRELAFKMGLMIKERPMNLRGIGGHKSEIVGIAEYVPVKVGHITKEVHFWVSSATVQPILGKPWLIDVSATIKFTDTGTESLSINKGGQSYLVPITNPANQKYETTFPQTVASANIHFLECGTFQE